MSFTDWDIYGTTNITRFVTSNGVKEVSFAALAANELAVAAPAGIPILGTGSSHMHIGSGESMNVLPKFPGFLATDRGFIAGKIRTILQWYNQGGVEHFGIAALQSVLNLTTGTFNAYGLACNTSGGNNNINIAQFDNTTVTGWTPLAISAPNAFSNGVPLAVEFEWDASSLTAVLLVVRTGTALNFSNLSVLISYIDTVNPHVTSVGEGLWAAGVSSDVVVYWDNTTIYKRI